MIFVTIFLCVIASISAFRANKRPEFTVFNDDNDSFDMMEGQKAENKNNSSEEDESFIQRNFSQHIRNSSLHESKLQQEKNQKEILQSIEEQD